MNIEDVKKVPEVPNILKAIFERQEELAIKYKEIEGLPDWPFDIDNPISQVWIKDFLWRICEEIAESMEAYIAKERLHTLEEIADALHFIVEIMILTDTSPPGWELPVFKQDDSPLYMDACVRVLFHAGLAGNTLKNKKWKQTHMPTDIPKFKELIRETLWAVLGVFQSMNCTHQDVFSLYFKKSVVNKFRQDTNY